MRSPTQGVGVAKGGDYLLYTPQPQKEANMLKKLNYRHPAFIILAGLAAIGVLFGIISLAVIKSNKIILRYDDLGIPYAEVYSEEQATSRLSADMVAYNGAIFIGGGDYDANTGPVPSMYYAPDIGVWEVAGDPLPDEQIKRFRVIDNQLYTLGTDPQDEWDYGNYYLFDSGIWETVRALPGGIHCFDAIEYGGNIYFGLGVDAGNFPAVVYNGISHSAVGFYKDGVLIDTSHNSIIRVYNLFCFEGKLYCFVTLDKTSEGGEIEGYYMELYVLEGENFYYVSGALPADDMPDVIAHGGSIYMILNGILLRSENLKDFVAVDLGKGASAADIFTEDGEVFVLAHRRSGAKRYESMVFKLADGGFKKLLGVKAKAPAGSFCQYGGKFFISLGARDELTPDTGRVIAVKAR